MSLSNETIKELKDIFQDDFGVVLTTQEASQSAYGLVGYFNLLLKDNNKINENEQLNNQYK